MKRIRIFGPRELAQQLADEMELRFEPPGLSVEVVAAYKPDEFGVQLPPDASLSAAFSLAARLLADQSLVFEFLPPKPTLIERFGTKYSSGRLRTAGAVAAGILADRRRTVWLSSKSSFGGWDRSGTGWRSKVSDSQAIQAKIQQYRPWFDDTFQDLAIMRVLSWRFPKTAT